MPGLPDTDICTVLRESAIVPVIGLYYRFVPVTIVLHSDRFRNLYATGRHLLRYQKALMKRLLAWCPSLSRSTYVSVGA